MDFASDCVGPEAEAKSRALADGSVLLLENVRFHAEEEADDDAFAAQLAALSDGIFVCDAFGSAHRAHASVVGITRHVHQAAAGLLMERELNYLGKALTHPDRPFIAILGGAKVSDKIEVVQNLMNVADSMLIGGAMAYTFLKSQGIAIGKSLVEDDKLDLARKLLGQAQSRNFRLLLPVDHVVAASPVAPETRTVDIRETPADMMGLDIGPRTVKLFAKHYAARYHRVQRPDGHVRKTSFRGGHAGGRQSRRGCYQRGRTSIVGGGDSVAALHQSGVADRISHISTGGGASLDSWPAAPSRASPPSPTGPHKRLRV